MTVQSAFWKGHPGGNKVPTSGLSTGNCQFIMFIMLFKKQAPFNTMHYRLLAEQNTDAS